MSVRHVAVISLFLVVAPTATGCAQDTRATLREYGAAREALGRTIHALGGLAAMQLVRTTTARFSGYDDRRGQTMVPEGADSGLVNGRVAFETRRNRFFTGIETTYSGGFVFDNHIAVDVDSGFNYLVPERQLTRLSQTELQILRRQTTLNPRLVFPHVLVLDILANAASLRADSEHPNRITFARANGTVATLEVASDGTPSRLVTLGDDFVLGDVELEVRFRDYRSVGNVRVPHRLEYYAGPDRAIAFVFTDVAFNEDIDGLFVPPGDVPWTTFQAAFVPQPVADGVYAIRLFSGLGLTYNTLVVEFADHLTVIEAPLNNLLSGAVIQVASQLAPGKPVRYVIPTHFHFDHSGGLQGYLAAGAAIVTTPGNVELWQTVAEATRTLQPVPAGRPPVIEVVEAKRTFGDATRSVDVYSIGPTPHVAEMLLVYLPNERVLFTTDLLSIPPSRHFPAPSVATQFLADVIDRLGLEPLVIVPGHGPVGTMEDLQAALRGAL